MNEKLNKLINDKTSGSSDLLVKLSLLFSGYADDKKALKELVSESEKHFTSFGAVESYLNKIKLALKEDQEKLREVILSPQKNEITYLKIFRNSVHHLSGINKIFTFSNSRTIFEIIKLYIKQNNGVEIMITESRPKKEGRVLAERIHKLGVKVEFGPDTYMPYFISSCDAVFCGADKLLEDGSIVNKTGTMNAAILAEHFHKPFFVFSESSKMSDTFKDEPGSSDEIWKTGETNIKIHNNYFEVVPANLISGVFTEVQ
jgi:translation initiation factor 2B subunit (eIF-2B alpha/beta/delta family)